MNKEFLAKEEDINELKINKADKADLSVLENSVDNLKTDKLDKSDVDSVLSSESENPVQNKVVYEAIQNVSLNPDISADFLTSEGFGNLRYYNGHFQKYDVDSDTWVDTTATPDNVYIFNMIPQPMKRILGVYDIDLKKYKLKFEEPDDTIIENQVVCVVDRVIIRRKLGAAPTNETDGILVAEIKRSEFGMYRNNFLIDTTFTPNMGDVYYYKAFPISTTGFCNVSSVNETNGLKCKDYNLYGFQLNQNESDPASMITYLNDCDNAQYISASMNYTTDVFDYGDWKNAWFIKNLKPCMLKYDGTVDYELDKNDYTKKVDGTDSDVANTAYEGNAMVGFPKVYWKIVDNGDNTANIYFCDNKIDDDFVCWSHIDNNGNEIDYCYMPIYTGSLVDDKLRSISGLNPMAKQTRQVEIDYAKANNLTDDIIWYTEVYSDRVLLRLLTTLIGKHTDTQKIFGTGNNNSYVSSSKTGVISSGTMNTKGMFWGNQDNISGVKMFGMEHLWGNTWRYIGGLINDKGTQKIKMTYGTSDGTTVTGYNLDGNGYISISDSTPSGTPGGYINKMKITEFGLLPIITNGSASTYYCDMLWFKNSEVGYGSVGGCGSEGSVVGMFESGFDPVTHVNWYCTVAPSCKPLAPTT